MHRTWIPKDVLQHEYRSGQLHDVEGTQDIHLDSERT